MNTDMKNEKRQIIISTLIVVGISAMLIVLCAVMFRGLKEAQDKGNRYFQPDAGYGYFHGSCINGT